MRSRSPQSTLSVRFFDKAFCKELWMHVSQRDLSSCFHACQSLHNWFMNALRFINSKKQKHKFKLHIVHLGVSKNKRHTHAHTHSIFIHIHVQLTTLLPSLRNSLREICHDVSGPSPWLLLAKVSPLQTEAALKDLNSHISLLSENMENVQSSIDTRFYMLQPINIETVCCPLLVLPLTSALLREINCMHSSTLFFTSLWTLHMYIYLLAFTVLFLCCRWLYLGSEINTTRHSNCFSLLIFQQLNCT